MLVSMLDTDATDVLPVRIPIMPDPDLQGCAFPSSPEPIMIPAIQSEQVQWSLGFPLRDILHPTKPSNPSDTQIQTIPQNIPQI